MADFEHDCDEILKDYSEVDDPVVESDVRNRLWKSLRGWQREKEYLSSLNLHRVIAKHVRISCRAVPCDGVCLETWVKRDSAGLDGLADEIATVIRGAWKVRFPLKPDTAQKFSEELSFESLDKFHLGLEELIGYPPTNLDFLDLMMQEHEQGEQFTDREGRVVDPKVEWNIVMKDTSWTIKGTDSKPTTQIKNRDCVQHLDYYIEKGKEKFAQANASGTLIEAEVAALRLWTGPMHIKYAQVLRNPQKQRGPYVTTLHAINSGIMKLARIWPLPASRKVYRGYKNLRLEDFQKDIFNCVGGVEKCVLATSEDFNIAVDYSVNDMRVGAFILEIDVGQVNRGADVSWLSQFPQEKEILFNALSNVEFVSSPHQRFVEGCGTILVYQVCVSANVKGKTLEAFFRLRRDLHMNLYHEAQRIISLREENCRYSLIKNLGAECRKQCDQLLGEAEAADFGIFNKRTQAHVNLEEAAIMLPSRSLEIMDLTLRWSDTQRADPADIDWLEDWQLQALRTSFECSERPKVRTIVLEQDHQVESLFGARSLNFDKLDTMGRAAKLLSLNPELVSLKIEDVSSTAQLWEKFGADCGCCRPSLCVNGFLLAKYAFRTLQQLELRALSDDIAIMIAPALLIHPPNALTSLSLRGSPIACTGAECLGLAFTGLQKLRYVDLSSCQIADEGCTRISQKLSALTELEDLNLAHNEVGDYGFNMLADAVRNLGLQRLKSVDLRYNNASLPSLECDSQCVIKSHVVSKFSTNAAVTCVVWSPEGDQIASVSENITIWDAKTGEQLSTLKGHTGSVKCAAWRPGGDQIVSGGCASGDAYYDHDNPGEILIWDAKTGEQLAVFKGHTKGVTCVAWCPGGDQIVSGGYGAGNAVLSQFNPGKIIIWDAQTGDQVSTLKGHTKAVTSVAWRPGGHQIASASHDTTIIIWDAKTGEQVSTLRGHTHVVTSVAWRLGGDQIASASLDKTIIIWDAKTGEQIFMLKGHTKYMNSVTWCPGGDQIVSGAGTYGIDGEVIVWDAKTGDKISELKGHTNKVTCVAWRPGGDQIVSGGFGYCDAEDDDPGEIIIWDAITGDKISEQKGHTNQITCVAWCPGGDQIVSGGYGAGSEYPWDNPGEIIIWDAKTCHQLAKLKGHTAGVTSVTWGPGSDQISSSSQDSKILHWDVTTWRQVATLKGRVKSVSWNDSDWTQTASAPDDTKIIIWDTKTGDQGLVLKGHSAAVTSVTWGPGCDQVVSGTADIDIIIWDAKTGDQVRTLKGHTDYVLCTSWNPNGSRIASGSDDRTVIIWDVMTGDKVWTLQGHTNKVTSVAWSPTAHHIVSGSSDTTLIIWDAETGDHVSTLKGHSGEVQSVGWNANGDHIASGSADGTIMIWDAKSWGLVSMLQGHSSKINIVVWSPNGLQVASVSDDQNVTIWDVNTRARTLEQLKGHADVFQSVAWSAVSGEQGT